MSQATGLVRYRVSSPLTNSGRPVSVYHRRVKVRSFYVKRWMLYIAAQCTAESINPKWVSKYHSISTVTDKIRRERERKRESFLTCINQQPKVIQNVDLYRHKLHEYVMSLGSTVHNIPHTPHLG